MLALRTPSGVLSFVVATCLIGWAASQVLAAAPICASNGYSNPNRIACTGTCPTEPATACPATATGSGGVQGGPYGTYKYCACPNEAESNCCHLIILDTGHTIMAIGACQLPGCPTQPYCKRAGTGGGMSSWQAICDLVAGD